jgi:hypothetical protein
LAEAGRLGSDGMAAEAEVGPAPLACHDLAGRLGSTPRHRKNVGRAGLDPRGAPPSTSVPRVDHTRTASLADPLPGADGQREEDRPPDAVIPLLDLLVNLIAARILGGQE